VAISPFAQISRPHYHDLHCDHRHRVEIQKCGNHLLNILLTCLSPVRIKHYQTLQFHDLLSRNICLSDALHS
jgi:hypothetical protein